MSLVGSLPSSITSSSLSGAAQNATQGVTQGISSGIQGSTQGLTQGISPTSLGGTSGISSAGGVASAPQTLGQQVSSGVQSTLGGNTQASSAGLPGSQGSSSFQGASQGLTNGFGNASGSAQSLGSQINNGVQSALGGNTLNGSTPNGNTLQGATQGFGVSSQDGMMSQGGSQVSSGSSGASSLSDGQVSSQGSATAVATPSSNNVPFTGKVGTVVNEVKDALENPKPQTVSALNLALVVINNLFVVRRDLEEVVFFTKSIGVLTQQLEGFLRDIITSLDKGVIYFFNASDLQDFENKLANFEFAALTHGTKIEENKDREIYLSMSKNRLVDSKARLSEIRFLTKKLIDYNIISTSQYDEISTYVDALRLSITKVVVLIS